MSRSCVRRALPLFAALLLVGGCSEDDSGDGGVCMGDVFTIVWTLGR
jgi:hypothetical protein